MYVFFLNENTPALTYLPNPALYQSLGPSPFAPMDQQIQTHGSGSITFATYCIYLRYHFVISRMYMLEIHACTSVQFVFVNAWNWNFPCEILIFSGEGIQHPIKVQYSFVNQAERLKVRHSNFRVPLSAPDGTTEGGPIGQIYLCRGWVHWPIDLTELGTSSVYPMKTRQTCLDMFWEVPLFEIYRSVHLVPFSAWFSKVYCTLMGCCIPSCKK